MADSNIKVVATNKKARHDYHIEDTLEAGIVLTGSEIKSVRAGQVSLRDSYAVIRNGEAWLVNAHIAAYKQASYTNHEPRRERKLLLHRREINRLTGKLQEKGFTLIPLRMYLKGSWAKVELGLARGKKLYDKRQSLRERDDRRQIERSLGRRQKEGW
ncbi:MAG: SsrA-binding protein SmpB [Chloroflexi bacterium]|nr:MAG: SsrA-binding protein SmpB [Chloroflexota bacterium]